MLRRYCGSNVYEGRRVERGPFSELVETIPEGVVGVMDLQKKKRVRLQGRGIRALNEFVHERDDYACVVPGCGKYVPIAEKWHHECCGASKEDVPEKGCLLCWEHHQERHFGKGSQAVKKACENYLRGLYPEVWKCELRRGEKRHE